MSKGYECRTSKIKLYSDTIEHREARLNFALGAIKWTAARLGHQIFSDKVCAHGGANSWRSVTVPVECNKQDIHFD